MCLLHSPFLLCLLVAVCVISGHIRGIKWSSLTDLAWPGQLVLLALVLSRRTGSVSHVNPTGFYPCSPDVNIVRVLLCSPWKCLWMTRPSWPSMVCSSITASWRTARRTESCLTCLMCLSSIRYNLNSVQRYWIVTRWTPVDYAILILGESS